MSRVSINKISDSKNSSEMNDLEVQFLPTKMNDHFDPSRNAFCFRAIILGRSF